MDACNQMEDFHIVSFVKWVEISSFVWTILQSLGLTFQVARSWTLTIFLLYLYRWKVSLYREGYANFLIRLLCWYIFIVIICDEINCQGTESPHWNNNECNNLLNSLQFFCSFLDNSSYRIFKIKIKFLISPQEWQNSKTNWCFVKNPT